MGDKKIQVFEMPLICTNEHKDNLNKRLRVACNVYNNHNTYYKKRYREITLSKQYVKDNKRLQKIYTQLELLKEIDRDKKGAGDNKTKFSMQAWTDNKIKIFLNNKKLAEEKIEFYESIEEKTEKESDDLYQKKFLLKQINIKIQALESIKEYSYKEAKAYFSELEKEKKDILTARNELYKEKGLTEYGVGALAIQYASKYDHLIPSNLASITVGGRLWSAYQKMLFSNGETVHYSKIKDFNSLTTNGKSGIRVLKDQKGIYLILSNKKAKTAKSKIQKIYLGKAETDYDDYFLREIEKNIEDKEYKALKLIRIIRRYEKSHANNLNPHFYVQFTLEAEPYFKKDKNGNELHKVNSGKVVLNLWRNYLVAINDKEIKTYDLAKGQEEYDEEKADLQRRLDENRRKNNPDNFNDDGTIKRGIKLTWITDNEYKRLSSQLRELQRKRSVNNKLLKRKIVWELLSMGNNFTTYSINLEAKRKKDKFYEEEPPKQSEMRKKARDRRGIQNAAPAELKMYLNSRLDSLELSPINEVSTPEEIFWYKHDNDKSGQEYWGKSGSISIANTEVDSILYHAFILYFYNNENKTLDKEGMKNNFYKYFK